MAVTTEQIKTLRSETGVSISECKKALEEAGGDFKEAAKILRQRGALVAEKKADRNLKSGTVASYIHAGGAVGTLVELLCETDFVAKNEEFKALAYDIAMHIAAMDPQTAAGGEGEDAMAALLEQPFIKDASQTIDGMVKSAVQKFGERIEIGRFSRFSVS